MTENQKAVLDKLQDCEMSIADLSMDLHIPPNPLRKVIGNMEKNGWVKKTGNYYSIAINYTPKIEWNFKPLLKAWSAK